MKKIAIACLLAVSTPLIACPYSFRASEPNTKIMDENGGIKLNATACKILAKKGFNLKISGQAPVINGVNIGWASISLGRNDIVSSEQSNSTYALTGAGGDQSKANTQLFLAIQDAVNNFNIEKAAEEVAAFTARNKKFKD